MMEAWESPDRTDRGSSSLRSDRKLLRSLAELERDPDRLETCDRLDKSLRDPSRRPSPSTVVVPWSTIPDSSSSASSVSSSGSSASKLRPQLPSTTPLGTTLDVFRMSTSDSSSFCPTGGDATKLCWFSVSVTTLTNRSVASPFTGNESLSVDDSLLS